MTIDTSSKRFSMMGFGMPPAYLVPKGSVDSGQRYTLLGLYSGIELTEIIAPAESIVLSFNALITGKISLTRTIKNKVAFILNIKDKISFNGLLK